MYEPGTPQTLGLTKHGEQDEAVHITDAWAKIKSKHTPACMHLSICILKSEENVRVRAFGL